MRLEPGDGIISRFNVGFKKLGLVGRPSFLVDGPRSRTLPGLPDPAPRVSRSALYDGHVGRCLDVVGSRGL